MKDLIINEKLKTLLPPLSAEEFAGLEESIVKDGCLSPLIEWNGTLVDGHYRYEICKKHQIPYAVKSVVLDSLDDAKLWIWKHQESRRNLTAFHRAEIALKLKEAIAAKAKERQIRKPADSVVANLPQQIEGKETREELAERAGVSHDTLHKVSYIVAFADEETKNRLRRGDKGTSIHREYKRLTSENAGVPSESKPAVSSETKIVLDKDTGMLRIRKDVTPKELAAFLVANYPIEYLRDLISGLMKGYHDLYGTESTQHFLLRICARYID